MTSSIFSLFCIGFFLGFFVSIPIGPISLVVIRRTLSLGKRAGYTSGLGAATADMLYAILAAISVTAIHTFILKKYMLLEVVGALVLMIFGLHTYSREPYGDEEETPSHHLYFSSLLLTLANPMTLVAFFAIFAGLKLSERAIISDLSLSVGLFFGSFVWWVVLTKLAHYTKHQFNHKKLHYLNRITGLIIALVGFYFLWH